MTREEELDWLYRLRSEIYVYMPKEWLIPMNDALDMAIKALEQEPCGDSISRQAVLELVGDYDLSMGQVVKAIHALPPVTPQPKTDKENIHREREQAYMQGYEDACKKYRQEPKWIPVSEKLPEDYELVLFSTKTDRVFEGRYFADNTDHQWYAFRDECFAWNNVVTAWMPLPKPYKAESEE